ncbi:unnamed protein product [Mortierella alpina]
MKFSVALIGFMSLVAGALVTEGQRAVQLNFGLIQALGGNRTMCLAAINSGAETHIQLQICSKRNFTQIWKFNTERWTIQSASPPDVNNAPQCLSRHHQLLTLAPCDSTQSDQQFFTIYNFGIAVDAGQDMQCIDVPGFNYTAGAQVALYGCKNPAERNQEWLTINA